MKIWPDIRNIDIDKVVWMSAIPITIIDTTKSQTIKDAEACVDQTGISSRISCKYTTIDRSIVTPKPIFSPEATEIYFTLMLAGIYISRKEVVSEKTI